MADDDNEDISDFPSPPPSPPHNISPTLTYITKFRQNTKGEFQMHLNSVPVTALADSGSARSLISSEVLALVKGEFYINYLEKKAFRPIHDANSRPLKILGAIQLDIRIEKFTTQAEFLCYYGANKTVLLGFLTLHKENLVVYPRLGLFSCNQATDEVGDACFLAASERNEEVTVEAQQLLLPVAACCQHTVPPGGSLNIPGQIILPSCGSSNKECFIYSTFVFSSEQLQKSVPLHKISIYYQYQTLAADLKVTLRFVNHFKTEQLIYPGEIIAHAQELPECPDEDIKNSGDEIIKYVHSIFRPDLQVAGDGDKMTLPHSDLGKTQKMEYAPGSAKKAASPSIAKAPAKIANPKNMRSPPTAPYVADAALYASPQRRGLTPNPSLITSHDSAPFTYRTDLHELKGPEEMEGSYSLNDIKIESTDPEEIAFIHEMHTKYKDAVSQHEYDAGEFCGDKIFFTLKKGTQSYHAKAFPIARHLKPQADALISQLLASGIIGKSTTPAHIISQVHFVEKAYPDLPPHKARFAGEKDTSKPRKIRAVINHKILNSAVNLPTRFPQPTIPEVLRKMHSATVASCCDLRAAFYSIRMHPTVFPYLAFEYCNELYYFRSAPMGFVLSSFALAAATQYMKLHHGLNQCDFVADDCIIYGETADDYKVQVEKFFIALKATGFKLHPKKSVWYCRNDLPILGFILNLPSRCLLASPQKIKGIMSMAQPRNKRDIKRFIGAISFMSQFIFGLQQLLRPLHTAASPKPPFAWTAECNEAWLVLKRSLAALPALRLPSPRYALQLHCDSSPNVTRALNWVWSQRQGDNKSYLVQFGSKCLSPQHWALSQPELELLGICSALKTDRHLVSYTSIEVNTDARGLTFLALYEYSQSKLRRWKLFLESLPITVRFRNNTDSYIRIADMVGRSRQQVIRALKIKKPLGKDNLVFPVYNFQGVQDLQFQHCMELIKSVVDMQKQANLCDSYPIMPDEKGDWRPLAGLLTQSAERKSQVGEEQQQEGKSRSLRFVPAARCPQPVPSGELAAAALPADTLAGVTKAEKWASKNWANNKITPMPPTLSIPSSYALTMTQNKRHHLPTIPHKSVYSNPSSHRAIGPLLLHKYEIHNLQSEEKEPALRFLLMVNHELRGFPLTAVKAAQQADPACEPIMAQLRLGQPIREYALFNGLLLRIIRQPSLKITLVLPQALGTKYLAHVHESTALFHLAAKDLIKMTSRYFSMQHLSKIAKQVAEDCPQCAIFNLQQHKAAVRGRRFVVSRPRQMLHCDVCSFFTGKQNKSYMVIVDIFSYLTTVYVLKTPETSEQLASHLLHYFSSHSVSAGICLDNAKVHEGALSQALALLNVRKFQISARLPAPNFVERVNSYLLQKIRLLYSAFQISEEQLPSLVSLATHIFNCTPLKSLDNLAPYTLHYGEGSAGIAQIPTVCVTPTSPLPPYIKALARVQTAMWDSINTLRRAKESKYREGNDPRRKPMFCPGDYVRMRADPDLTARNHKIAPKYKSDLYKCIKVLPKSGNYILLKMSHGNQLRYGFFSKVGVPKRALVYAKESRLKKCKQQTTNKDPLGAKLLTLFSNVALENYHTPKEFDFCPQVGKTFAVDRKLQKLTNFVLNREIPCPPDVPQLIEKRIRDSEFGELFPPSVTPARGDSGGKEEEQICHRRSIAHYRLVPAPPPPSYESIVRKILPEDLAELHLAAGCKPSAEDARGQDDDDDGDSEAERRAHRRRQLQPRRPGRAAIVARSPAATATRPPAAAAPPYKQQQKKGLQERAADGPAPLPHVPRTSPQRSNSSRASSVSSTGAIHFDWDPTFDFLQPAARPAGTSRGGARRKLKPDVQVSKQSATAAPPTTNNLRLLLGKNVDEGAAGNISSSSYDSSSSSKKDNSESEDNDDNDNDEYFDAGEDNRIGDNEQQGEDALAGAAGLPLALGEQEAVVGAGHQGPLPLRPRLPNFKLAYGHCDTEILDLPLPPAPIALHGPQVFGNDGIAQADMVWQPSTKTSKKAGSKGSKQSQNPAEGPPPTHPLRSRPVSSRLASKSKK